MFKLMGIDPGSKTLGISILTINNKNRIESINTYLLNVHHIDKRYRKGNDISYKLKSIRNGLKLLIDDKVIGVSIENPFMYGNRPGAVIPLGKVLGIIEEYLVEYNENILIRRISPSEVKKFMGVSGISNDKNDIYNALKKKKISKYIDLNYITDHEWDAISISLELYNYYLTNPYYFI